MASTTIRTHIDAPIGDVFRLFSDLPAAADHIAAIEEIEVLTDGPMQVGTRFRETRTMYGKQATEEMEVTSYSVNNGYTVEAESHGAHYTSVYRFEDRDDGTDVTLTFEARPVSLLARLLSPLSPLMLKSVAKAVQQDMVDLKSHLEQSAEQH